MVSKSVKETNSYSQNDCLLLTIDLQRPWALASPGVRNNSLLMHPLQSSHCSWHLAFTPLLLVKTPSIMHSLGKIFLLSPKPMAGAKETEFYHQGLNLEHNEWGKSREKMTGANSDQSTSLLSLSISFCSLDLWSHSGSSGCFSVCLFYRDFQYILNNFSICSG